MFSSMSFPVLVTWKERSPYSGSVQGSGGVTLVDAEVSMMSRRGARNTVTSRVRESWVVGGLIMRLKVIAFAADAMPLTYTLPV